MFTQVGAPLVHSKPVLIVMYKQAPLSLSGIQFEHHEWLLYALAHGIGRFTEPDLERDPLGCAFEIRKHRALGCPYNRKKSEKN